MITAVDSCVLLDIAVNDARHSAKSSEALKKARKQGRVIVSECVVSEISPICGSQTEEFLDSLNIGFVPISKAGSLLAGKCSRIIWREEAGGGESSSISLLAPTLKKIPTGS